MMHIGTGLVCGYKILDMVKAGFDFTILLADWHAWINNKFGGDMETIRFCGEYFVEAFSSIGLTPDKVKYVWASDLVKKEGYWETVVKVAKKSNLSRIIRCLPIMGRELNPKDVEAAYLFYPLIYLPYEIAKIVFLVVNILCLILFIDSNMRITSSRLRTIGSFFSFLGRGRLPTALGILIHNHTRILWRLLPGHDMPLRLFLYQLNKAYSL